MERLAGIARWSSWVPGCWLLGILVSLVIGSVPVCPAHALGSTSVDVPGQFTFHELTARIVGASLQQAMAEMTRLSRVEVRWMDAAVREQVVWVEFTALPLSDAGRRILREINLLFWYAHSDEGTRLTQLWIASREAGGGAAGALSTALLTRAASADRDRIRCGHGTPARCPDSDGEGRCGTRLVPQSHRRFMKLYPARR